MLYLHICMYRLQILQNIGAVFVKMGQYSDAMTSYEHVMSEKPSMKAGQYMHCSHCGVCVACTMYIRVHIRMRVINIIYTNTLIKHTPLSLHAYVYSCVNFL